MEKIQKYIAIIGLLCLFGILLTPLIWIWCSFILCIKIAGTLAVITYTCYLINLAIDKYKKQNEQMQRY
jgi:hypothetical protein